MLGNDNFRLYLTNAKELQIYNSTTQFCTLGLQSGGGNIALKESTAAPTDVAGWAQLFTKADNKMYFVDGAGATKEIATV